MTISKVLRQRRGNALIVALIIAVIVLLVGAGMMTKSIQQSRFAKRVINETRALITAHGYASLIKQELLTNYNNYQTAASWAPCRLAGKVSIDSFLHILDNPGDSAYVSDTTNCPTVVFAFDYFATLDTPATSSVALSTLKAKRMVAKADNRINDFDFEFGLADFNLNPLRNSVSSAVTLNTSAKGDVPVNKTLRLVIDVKRTLSAAANGQCSLCRTTPGAVCCGEITLSFLESSGRVMDVVYDAGSKLIVDTRPNVKEAANLYPTAASLKNLPGSTKAYAPGSFCVPAIQSDSLKYVIDAAVGDGSQRYYLTVHGDVIKTPPSPDTATFTRTVVDPKLMSLAYENSQWYLLRSDGQVLRSDDPTQTTHFISLEGLNLPTAVALASGSGPTETCP